MEAHYLKKCIKNLSPKQAYLKQLMVSLHDGKKTIKKRRLEVGVFLRPSFLPKGLRLPNKLDFLENIPSKKCCHTGIHVIFFSHAWSSPPDKSWPQCKPWPVKNPVCSQSCYSIPLIFLIGALLRYISNQLSYSCRKGWIHARAPLPVPHSL